MLNLKYSPTKSFKLLAEMYGVTTVSRTRVFERHKRLGEGRVEEDDDKYPGRTSKTDENVDKIHQDINKIFRNNQSLSIRITGNMINMINMI